MSAPRATWFPATVVTLASAGVGGAFGELAHLLYSFEHRGRHAVPDGAVGAIAGLLVGVGWVAFMRGRSGAGARWLVVAWGVLGGLVAGGVATLLLHAVLGPTHPSAGRWLRIVFEGEWFGLPAGAILGLMGGLGWYVSLRVAGGRSERTTVAAGTAMLEP